MFSTVEDIYVALVDTDRGQKEKVHFYDTAGLVSCSVSLHHIVLGYHTLLIFRFCLFNKCFLYANIPYCSDSVTRCFSLEVVRTRKNVAPVVILGFTSGPFQQGRKT